MKKVYLCFFYFQSLLLPRYEIHYYQESQFSEIKKFIFTTAEKIKKISELFLLVNQIRTEHSPIIAKCVAILQNKNKSQYEAIFKLFSLFNIIQKGFYDEKLSLYITEICQKLVGIF
jgi:hypothetical protein